MGRTNVDKRTSAGSRSAKGTAAVRSTRRRPTVSTSAGTRARAGRLNLTAASPAETVRKLERGFRSQALSDLKSALSLSWADLAELLQITPRTLKRRREQRRIHTDESERVLRISRIYDRAIELFEGDAETALHWLKQPNRSLGNRSPLWFAKTEPGAREVEDLIGRLEHGVFS